MELVTIAIRNWRYLASCLVISAFLILYAGYTFRGYEIDRLNTQAALVEQAAKLRSERFIIVADELKAERARKHETLKYIVRGIPNDKTAIPVTMADTFAKLCDAGASCETPK